jgi:hypothetical protein
MKWNPTPVADKGADRRMMEAALDTNASAALQPSDESYYLYLATISI